MKKIHHRLQSAIRSPLWALIIPFGWLLFFFLIPFLIVLKISFSELRWGVPPYGPLLEGVGEGILVIKLNLSNYGSIAKDALYFFTYLESLIIALLGTVGCLLIGYPMAYGIARSSPPFRTILLMMIVLPFWTSFLLRVYAWMGLLGTHGLFNMVLLKMGLITTPITFLDTPFATLLGIIYCYLPFMILPLYAALEKIDPLLMEAAYDLGARPFQAFWRITWPLSLPGVITGSMLVLIPAVGEFVIPELLGGSQTLMIGKVIWNEFFTNRDWPVATALAILTLLFLIVPITIFQRFQERQGRFLNAD